MFQVWEMRILIQNDEGKILHEYFVRSWLPEEEVCGIIEKLVGKEITR